MKELRRIFNEGKWAWITLMVMLSILTSMISYLYRDGYFNTRTIGVIQNQRVKILDVYANWGNRVLVQAKMSNALPVEVKMPNSCQVDSKKWMGAELDVEVITRYRPFNHTEYLEFPGLAKICS